MVLALQPRPEHCSDKLSIWVKNFQCEVLMEFEIRIQKLRTLTTWAAGTIVLGGFLIVAIQILLA